MKDFNLRGYLKNNRLLTESIEDLEELDESTKIKKTIINMLSEESVGKFVVRPCSAKDTPWAVWKTSKGGENDKRIKGFKTKEDAQKFANEKNSLDEANVSWSTIHSELTEAYVPQNIEEFAKRKGITSLVNRVAGWAEKVGARISGGVAIGKDYNTLVLDMKYQAGEITINIDNETITLFDQPITSLAQFKKVYGEKNQVKEEEEFEGEKPVWVDRYGDGWNEEWAESIGLMEFFQNAEKLAYEIRNAKIGSYALRGVNNEEAGEALLEYIYGLRMFLDDIENNINEIL